MDVCTARGAQGPACLALAMELQLDARGAAAAEAAVGSPEAGASTLHGQGCETRLKPPSAAKHLGQVGRVHGGFPRRSTTLWGLCYRSRSGVQVVLTHGTRPVLAL